MEPTENVKEGKKMEPTEAVKYAIAALEKSMAKSNTYWNILWAVSFGAITIAASGAINIYIACLGYLVIGISNFQAIVRFQIETIVLSNHVQLLLKKNEDKVSETLKVVYEAKTIISTPRVAIFHICMMALAIFLMVVSYQFEILNPSP